MQENGSKGSHSCAKAGGLDNGKRQYSTVPWSKESADLWVSPTHANLSLYIACRSCLEKEGANLLVLVADLGDWVSDSGLDRWDCGG